MVMYEAGMLARSKAGHDKAKMYIIKEWTIHMYIWWMDESEHSSILKKKKTCADRSWHI